MIIGGSAILAMDIHHPARPKLRLVMLMLACAFSLAGSWVIFKLFAVKSEFWGTTFWTYAGEALFGVFVLTVRRWRREFSQLLRASTGPLVAINAANELINLAGGLIARYALLLAPLGLVQAISSTTTIFVFLFGIVLALLFPRIMWQDLSKQALLQNAAGILLVAAGVVIA
jgi:hypothetical protein